MIPNDTSPMLNAKPPHQRPELPDFWDHRFQNGVVPWDAGGAPIALRAFAERLASDANASSQRILIPGCGSAHDARFLSERGLKVVALDFSGAALDVAKRILGQWQGELLHADFFQHRPQSPYTVVYERAFLCALPRKLWPDYGPRMAELLGPGGLLAGYFLFGEEVKGPPFPIVRAQLEALLTPYFDLIEDAPVEDSLDVFRDRERWLVWRRRGDTDTADTN